MNKRFRVKLTAEQRKFLTEQLAQGKLRATKMRRAQILLGSDEHADGKRMIDEEIAQAYGVSKVTIYYTRRRFVEEGFDLALQAKVCRTNAKRKVDGRAESQLIALRCSDPPPGENRWSLRLLADRMVELGLVESISRQGVSNVLKKHQLSLGGSSPG
jgi:transposase